MNTSYVLTQPVSYGEIRPAVLVGSGPTSYSQTTGDVIANPAAGDYIYAVMAAMAKSKNYFVVAFPSATGVGQIRAGGASASASGWTFKWYNVAPATGIGSEVTNATNLSAETVQFGVLVGQI